MHVPQDQYFFFQGNSTLLFKKKVMSSEDEEDNYEQISNGKSKKSNKKVPSNAFIKNGSCSSMLTNKDKKVSYVNTYLKFGDLFYCELIAITYYRICFLLILILCRNFKFFSNIFNFNLKSKRNIIIV